jgi:hypothetical protein
MYFLREIRDNRNDRWTLLVRPERIQLFLIFVLELLLKELAKNNPAFHLMLLKSFSLYKMLFKTNLLFSKL